MVEPVNRAKPQKDVGINNVSVELFERCGIGMLPPVGWRRADAAHGTQKLAGASVLQTARPKHSVIESEAHP